MNLYLLTTPDYSTVLGYAEREDRDPHDFSLRDARAVTGFDTDQRPLFTRKGLAQAERRAHALGLRLVTAAYFGISSTRPTGISASAHARLQEQARHQQGGAA